MQSNPLFRQFEHLMGYDNRNLQNKMANNVHNFGEVTFLKLLLN